MIFDGCSVEQLTDQEILALVEEGTPERVDLEFKATFEYKRPEKKAELLRDIAAMANGGGGYIIIGIREDGQAKAADFTGRGVGDTEAIARCIADLCLEHIRERLTGLEVHTRDVEGYPMVIIHIPHSVLGPHMVTLDRRTEFHIRHHNRKREMTLSEIRDAFQGDFVVQRLAALERELRLVRTAVERAQPAATLQDNTDAPLASVADGEAAAMIAQSRFRATVGGEPTLRIFATPAHSQSGRIDVQSPDIRRILQSRPDDIPGSWRIAEPSSRETLFFDDLRLESLGGSQIELHSNGYLEFRLPLDAATCGRLETSNAPKHLNPYAIAIYPLMVLSAYKMLVTEFQLEGVHLSGIECHSLRGFRLRPGHPESMRYASLYEKASEFTDSHFYGQSKSFPADFSPHVQAHELVEQLYRAFGYRQENVPFYNGEREQYSF